MKSTFIFSLTYTLDIFQILRMLNQECQWTSLRVGDTFFGTRIDISLLVLMTFFFRARHVYALRVFHQGFLLTILHREQANKQDRVE